ncbi:MAG: sulfotransferase [Methylohalobius sp.]|nr:sulfotransferase [Methylohalobius sp.]
MLEACLKQAWQAVERGDAQGAERWFRQALTYDSRHLVARAGLGQALCRQGRRREGLSHLREVAERLLQKARKPEDLRNLLDLAEQLAHWQDLVTAVRLLRRVLKLAPEEASVHNNLALYLLRLNRPEEAFPHAKKALRLLPQHPACQNLVATIQAQLGQLSEARLGFERVIAHNMDVRQTARAWQELSGVLDRMREYEAAFAAAERAKALHAVLPEFKAIDPGRVYRSVSLSLAGLDEGLLRRWAPEALADGWPRPVFLMGFLRSGTTLTEQVLGAHPKVVVSDENELLDEVVRKMQQMTGCGENIPHGLRQLSLEQARQLRAYYWQRVGEEYGEEALDRCFVDKGALHTLALGVISVLFPEAKLIFCVRDPRDVCLSCFLQIFKPAWVTVNLLSWEGVAKQYAAVMELWLKLRQAIAPAWMELRYEEAVAGFAATYRHVLAFLGLEWTDEIASFYRNAKGRYISTPSFAAVSQPVYTRAVGRWQHYEKFFPPILPQLAPYLAAFGYYV